MVQKNTTIFNKLEILEKELQRLKMEVVFSLPLKKRKSLYPEKGVLKAVEEARRNIWQRRYAKKV